MNVLGIAFDYKLNWHKQIQSAITKSTKALHAIKLISKHFNKTEIKNFLTSNYFSVLYYNSEIWHSPSLSVNSKKYLFSASARALKLCTPNYDQSISHSTLHVINNQATPKNIMKYKTALMLHKLYNNTSMSFEWQQLFFNQNFNTRNNHTNFLDLSNYRIGKNLLTNRFCIINNTIP